MNRHPRTKAPPSSPSPDASALVSKTIQTTDYRAHMATEMAAMSTAIGLPLLAHLLHLVRAQAELEAQAARDE